MKYILNRLEYIAITEHLKSVRESMEQLLDLMEDVEVLENEDYNCVSALPIEPVWLREDREAFSKYEDWVDQQEKRGKVCY